MTNEGVAGRGRQKLLKEREAERLECHGVDAGDKQIDVLNLFHIRPPPSTDDGGVPRYQMR